MTPMKKLTKRMWATTPTKRFRLITTTAWPRTETARNPMGGVAALVLLAILRSSSVYIAIEPMLLAAISRMRSSLPLNTAEAHDEMHEEFHGAFRWHSTH